MKAKNVSVSLYEQEGELRIWCASFTIKGSIPPTKDWKAHETAVRKKCREIEKILEAVDFTEELPQ
jgi:hypothetical protein